ncbi:MAG: hypothetical protein ACKOEW_07575 [Methylocystis sp.]
MAALPLWPAHAPASLHSGAVSTFYPVAPSAGRILENRPASFIGRQLSRRGLAICSRPGVGLLAVAALFSGVGFMGWAQNGGYDDFAVKHGAPWDMAARALGFEISAVTITGQSRVCRGYGATQVNPAHSHLLHICRARH